MSNTQPLDEEDVDEEGDDYGSEEGGEDEDFENGGGADEEPISPEVVGIPPNGSQEVAQYNINQNEEEPNIEEPLQEEDIGQEVLPPEPKRLKVESENNHNLKAP